MPYRKDKRNTIITRSCPPQPLSRRAPESITLWWLAGAIVTCDWHMGHYKGINEGDVEIEKSISQRVNEVQLSIAQCIRANKGVASFNDIVDHVSKRWQSLRKRDGLPYHTRIRHAVEAGLTDNDAHDLFKLETGTDVEGNWTLISRGNEDDNSDAGGSDSEIRPAAERKELTTKESEALMSAAAKNSLTDLQALIIEALVLHKGTAHLDQICEHVAEKWGTLKKRDGTPYSVDCRRAVISSLTNSFNDTPLFRRVKEKYHNWVLTTHTEGFIQHTGIDLSDISFAHAGSTPDDRKDQEENQESFSPERNDGGNTLSAQNSRSTSRTGDVTPTVDVVESENIRDGTYVWPTEITDAGSEVAVRLGLTSLQILLLRILGAIPEGKAMNIEDIYDRVDPLFVYLKRRDGSVYSTDHRRATLSSLTNSPSVPLFKKVNRNTQVWMLASGGMEKLALYRAEITNNVNHPKDEENMSETNRAVGNTKAKPTSVEEDVEGENIQIRTNTSNDTGPVQALVYEGGAGDKAGSVKDDNDKNLDTRDANVDVKHELSKVGSPSVSVASGGLDVGEHKKEHENVNDIDTSIKRELSSESAAGGTPSKRQRK
eukprot:CFRG5557T1